MDELKKSVETLRNAKNKTEQIKALQNINKALLTLYEIKVGDIVIDPIVVEAYYHTSDFEDANCHQRPGQMEHMGKLYFHEAGRGGVDICLSDGSYFLSFLLKCTKVNQVFCKQIALRDTLHGKEKMMCELIFREQPKSDCAIFVPRKNLAYDTFKEEKLAAVTLSALKYKSVCESLQEGKLKTVARYFKQEGETPTEEKIKEILGYTSKEVIDTYHELCD